MKEKGLRMNVLLLLSVRSPACRQAGSRDEHAKLDVTSTINNQLSFFLFIYLKALIKFEAPNKTH